MTSGASRRGLGDDGFGEWARSVDSRLADLARAVARRPAVLANPSERDAAYPAPYRGLLVQVGTAIHYYDGTGWLAYDLAPVSITPTLTNVTLGTGGTAALHYWRNGALCKVRANIILGTAGSPTWNVPTIDLPFAGADPLGTFGRGLAWGPAFVYDANASANRALGMVVPADSAPVAAIVVQYVNASLTQAQNATISASAPFAVQASDEIHVGLFEYQMNDPYAAAG